MLASTRRGLAMATDRLTSLAASQGSQSTLNPGCRSWVPHECLAATKIHGKLSRTVLPTLF